MKYRLYTEKFNGNYYYGIPKYLLCVLYGMNIFNNTYSEFPSSKCLLLLSTFTFTVLWWFITFSRLKLTRFPVNANKIFQQDGATSHPARISMNSLFPGRVVSRNPRLFLVPSLYGCNLNLLGSLKTILFLSGPP